MRSGHWPRAGAIVALLIFAWAIIAAEKGLKPERAWLPVTELTFADNGDLTDISVNHLGVGPSALIEPGKRLLTLRVEHNGRTVTDEMEWAKSSTPASQTTEFRGTHPSLEFEITRSYQITTEDKTSISHVVEVNWLDGPVRGELAAELVLGASLRKHALEDGSLGDLFYGYGRVFSGRGQDEFRIIQEETQTETIALATRHVALVVAPAKSENSHWSVSPGDGGVLVLGQSIHRHQLDVIKLGSPLLRNISYGSLIYPEMTGALAALARLVEKILYFLTGQIGNAGAAVVMFAILFRLMLLPVGLWSLRQQRRFTAIQLQMQPKIDEIKRTLTGAEKNEEILQTYKEYGISPFSGLKGSIGLFVQLPILISLFAVTTESALFREVAFLWAGDLSLPDRLFALPVSVPGLGGYLNLLPLVLGAICVIAALVQQRSTKGPGVGSARSGLLLALVFVVFFYSCAAVLVLYWTVVNLLQFFESRMANWVPEKA